MIPKEDLVQIRKRIQKAARPLFIFDGDCDGICAYLILKTLNKESRGTMIRGDPIVTLRYVDFVYDFQPDLIILLDAGNVTQEFIDEVRRPIIWIDHHELQERNNVDYYNPQQHDKENRLATSYWAYQIAQNKLWLAATGIVADWQLPPNTKQIQEEFPGYMDGVTTGPQALFESQAGQMVDIIDFNLKGVNVKPLQVVKTLDKIQHPKEIFEQTTEEGAWIYKRAVKHMDECQALIEAAKQDYDKEDPLLVFRYTENQTSFTRQIANRLVYEYPEKFIIIVRRKNGDMKMSLRCTECKHS